MCVALLRYSFERIAGPEDFLCDSRSIRLAAGDAGMERFSRIYHPALGRDPVQGGRRVAGDPGLRTQARRIAVQPGLPLHLRLRHE